jgi:hypothetical protein
MKFEPEITKLAIGVGKMQRAGNQLAEALDLLAMRYHETGEMCWCRESCFVQGSATGDCRKANDAIKQWKEARR